MAAAPPVGIWLEARSRNTRENAQFTNQLLRRHPGVDTLVLVTSAFHMRWAEGCSARPITGCYPAPKPLSLLLHEMAGWAAYKVRGWC